MNWAVLELFSSYQFDLVTLDVTVLLLYSRPLLLLGGDGLPDFFHLSRLGCLRLFPTFDIILY